MSQSISSLPRSQAMKRLLPEDSDDGSGQSRKYPRLWSVGREVINLQQMRRLLVPLLEPVVRRVVREELEQVLMQVNPSVLRPPINCVKVPGTIGPRLHFKSRLLGPYFTGSKVSPVQIVICGGTSEEPLTTGPLSSIKVEIIALDGDFGKDEKESWTKEEFDTSIVSARDGKRPLLAGDLVITLRNGIGTFTNVMFTDNSSWVRSRKFRLGVRVVQSSGFEGRIREARSEPFVVKDHRGELYKKHDCPSLKDAVWRLKNIGKDGVFRRRLTDRGIETVEQFLRFSVTNEVGLRLILGSGMSDKLWKETISHARKCNLDGNFYIYFGTGKNVCILLNSIYEVVKAKFDGWQSFQSLDSLHPLQKSLVEEVKEEAYGNQESIKEFNGISSLGLWKPLPELPGTSFTVPITDPTTYPNGLALLDVGQLSVLPQGRFTIDQSLLKYPAFSQDWDQFQPTSLTQNASCNMSVADEVDQQLVSGNTAAQDLQLSQPFSPFYSNYIHITNNLSWPSGDNRNIGSGSGTMFGDFPFHMMHRFNGTLNASGDENYCQCSDIGSTSKGIVKPKGWHRLGAPLKWGILVRKNVGAERLAESCV